MALSTLAAAVAIALVTFVVVAGAVALGVLIALAVVVKAVTPGKISPDEPTGYHTRYRAIQVENRGEQRFARR